MPWLYEMPDDKIEIIIDPRFGGDIIELARSRPVWIVDTEANRPKIDEVWHIGTGQELYEVSRCHVNNPEDREHNLLDILGSLDDHYGSYDFIAHGIAGDGAMRQRLVKEGFRIVEDRHDGFVALRIPGVRKRLIGREQPSKPVDAP